MERIDVNELDSEFNPILFPKHIEINIFSERCRKIPTILENFDDPKLFKYNSFR